MAIIVNQFTEPYILTVSYNPVLHKVIPTSFLDLITTPVRGVGVKRDKYWIINLARYDQQNGFKLRNTYLASFAKMCSKKLFSDIMFKL